MPKVAILFVFLLISPLFTNSHAFPIDPFISLDDTGDLIIHNSDIIDVDSDFFLENNFKRYLIFGSNSHQTNILENNSLYGVSSVHGFFYVSILAEKAASNLIAQGYNVIEDSKLDFHTSDQIISDVSRIGDITGSTTAKAKYDATGSDIVVAIVDTGVDF